jgi:hypothetical protein
MTTAEETARAAPSPKQKLATLEQKWKDEERGKIAALVERECERAEDFIRDDEGREVVTRSAVNEVMGHLELHVRGVDYHDGLDWQAVVTGAEDYDQEYLSRRFKTIQEAAEWGATALMRLAEDCNDAIQDALQGRMKELRASASDQANAPHSFR